MDPSVEKKLTTNWNQLDPKGNKMTFFGVLYQYYNMVAKHWRSIDTQRNYMGHYNDYLLEHVKDRPLEDFEREDFVQVIDAVCESLLEKGRKAGEDQRQHYRVLIRRVTKTAAETETRAGYRNEEKLYPIYQKMRRRFLVNSVEPLELAIEDALTNIADETQISLHIPCKKRGRVQIQVHSNEADSELRISTRTKGIRASARLLQWPDLQEMRETVNVMEIMRKRYDSALKKEISKETQNDEDKM